MAVLEQERRKDERSRLQAERILAVEFARERGWLFARTEFSLEQLSRRSNKIRHKEDTIFRGCDLNFYRERSSRRPAAIAMHIANPDLASLEEIARRFSLQVEVVRDFPGWVDGSQLIVYTPSGEAPQRRKRRKEHSERCPKQLFLPF